MERSVNKSSRLTRHFAAAAAAAVVGASASAGVVYTAVNWVVPNNIDGLYINVETLATGSAGSAVAGWDINPYSATSLTWFNATGTGMLRYPGVTTGSAGNLAVGTVVGATGSYGSGAVTVGTAAGNWRLNASNYFGFRFVASDGLTHYGWGRFVIGASISGADRYIAEIAWENIAGASIAVGDQGGPPPAYDPCAAFNPKANIGTSNLGMNGTTAQNLTIPQFTIFKANYFKFDCTASGTYTINSCSSNVDTRMAVTDGCTGSAAVLAADDNGCGLSSTMQVSLNAGTSYYVVCGMASASAAVPQSVAITVAPPPDPICVAAMPLSFGTNGIDGTAGVGTQVVKSSATGGTTTIYNVLWHKFTPQATGAYTFSLCGSYGDSKMAIAANCPGVGGTFDSLAYNDDTCACSGGCGTTGTSAYAAELKATGSGLPLTQDLIAGQTYYLCIGGYAAVDFPVGALTISGPPQPPLCPADLDQNGTVDGADLGMLLGNWGNSGIGDINNDGTVNGADLGALLGAFGPCI